MFIGKHGPRPSLILAPFLVLIAATTFSAQTSSFTYQGRVVDGGTAANGNYDLQFALFDSLAGGTQIGTTQTVSPVAVSAGIFSVQLDFGASAFPGANRFLEINARVVGAPAYTLLAPRQQITSTPYAVRALSATTSEGLTTIGSGNFIQNTTATQSGANFNVSGSGTASGTLSGNFVNATTQYNIAGNRVLAIPGLQNTFVGLNAGGASTGPYNAFFGFEAGASNSDGDLGAFFGRKAGADNTTGSANSFFGSQAGLTNTTGSNNAFFGFNAGFNNGSGVNNAFFGYGAGFSNGSGSNNVLIGNGANVGSSNLNNSTAVGTQARVDRSDALVLGSVAGFNGATASVNVGIGTTSPTTKLDIRSSTAFIRLGGVDCGPNFGAITFGNVALTCTTYSLLGEGANTFINRPAGGVITFRENNNEQMVLQAGGNVVFHGRGEFGSYLKLNQIETGFGEGTVHLCRNGANVVATCNSSSLRYKHQIAPFIGGLALIRQLRPINFTWKMEGSRDFGLAAEDVAKVEPRLITHNDKGEIDGVKYEHLNLLFINAIKQQQDQIATLQAENAALNKRLLSVEKIVRKTVSSSRRRR